MIIGVAFIDMSVVTDVNLIRYAFNYRYHVNTKLRMLNVALLRNYLITLKLP